MFIPIALWVSLGWCKASDGVTIKIPSFQYPDDYWLMLGRASNRKILPNYYILAFRPVENSTNNKTIKGTTTATKKK